MAWASDALEPRFEEQGLRVALSLLQVANRLAGLLSFLTAGAIRARFEGVPTTGALMPVGHIRQSK